MEEKTFPKGAYVVYGTNGICVVEDVKMLSFDRGGKESLYYILKPEGSNTSTIFVPADNDRLMAKIRNVMTKEEIDELLLGMRDKEFAWERDRRYRTENFHEILSRGVREELLLMIRCIYLKKQELAGQGKKLPAMDMNTLKTAEKLVEEEFTHVLKIETEAVGKYIRDLLHIDEEETV